MRVLSRLCHKLGLLSLSLAASLSFHAVAREAGRMRSPAAAEGHGAGGGNRQFVEKGELCSSLFATDNVLRPLCARCKTKSEELSGV